MTRPAPMDPYAVLGVPRTATARQVARAHRRLAKRFHPDLHPGSETAERMRLVNEAWRILSSAERRTAYDREHPTSGLGVTAGAHWAPSRHPIRPAQPTTTRTWASWRASAAETRLAPRTRRAPGEQPAPSTRRPPAPLATADRSFRDSGWAAVLVAVVVLGVALVAVFFGRMAAGF